jgi:hypothetical protein
LRRDLDTETALCEVNEILIHKYCNCVPEFLFLQSVTP